jgi:hypothetical protein
MIGPQITVVSFENQASFPFLLIEVVALSRERRSVE